MNLNTNNDPDLIETIKELDEEFPGAEHDDSLQKYQNKRETKKRIIKKIVFHGFFYSMFTIGIYLLFKKYNISVFSSMIYALTWFLFYILIKNFLPSKHSKTFYGEFMEAINDTLSISRPYDKPMEGK